MRGARFALVVMALMLSTVAYAQTPAKGQDAPAINVRGWVMNEPEGFDGTNLKGQVVLLEEWGKN